MIKIKTLVTLLSLLLPGFLFAVDKAKHVNADEAARLIAKGDVTVVDVRTADEFKSGHLQGAKNIDILSDDFEAQLSKLDKSKPTLVHCQSGGRSTRALPVLEKLGFTNILHLDGGYGGWEAAGKPVEK